MGKPANAAAPMMSQETGTRVGPAPAMNEDVYEFTKSTEETTEAEKGRTRYSKEEETGSRTQDREHDDHGWYSIGGDRDNLWCLFKLRTDI